jgi:hypothetical protein
MIELETLLYILAALLIAQIFMDLSLRIYNLITRKDDLQAPLNDLMKSFQNFSKDNKATGQKLIESIEKIATTIETASIVNQANNIAQAVQKTADSLSKIAAVPNLQLENKQPPPIVKEGVQSGNANESLPQSPMQQPPKQLERTDEFREKTAKDFRHWWMAGGEFPSNARYLKLPDNSDSFASEVPLETTTMAQSGTFVLFVDESNERGLAYPNFKLNQRPSVEKLFPKLTETAYKQTQQEKKNIDPVEVYKGKDGRWTYLKNKGTV